MKIAQHIDHARAVRWFLIIFVPIFMTISALIEWRNRVVDTPSDAEIMVRAIVAMVAILVGLVLFAWKVIRPAMKKAQDDHDAQKPNADR